MSGVGRDDDDADRAPTDGDQPDGPPRRRSDRLDAFQRRHPVLGFPIAVFYKFIDDQGVYLAALITYYSFLSVFPLLLLLSSIVGFVLQEDLDLQRRILDSAVSQFPIIGDAVGSPQGLRGSVFAVVAGAALAIYGALGVAQATQHAMNTAWAVPRHRRPNPIIARLRSLFLLSTGGLVVLATMILGGIASGTDTFDSASNTWFRIGIGVAGIVVNTVIFTIGFRITTALRLSVRQVIVGAFINAMLWWGLQYFGATYVSTLQGADNTYGTFAVVFGLLGWFFLAALALVMCVEINVVRTKRLYPRALLTPFTDNVDLTEADQRIYAEAANAQRLKGFEVVDVRFRHDGQFASAQRRAAWATGNSAAVPPLARPGGGRAGAEQVEIVAADGTLERIVSRAEMRREHLRTRVTMVAILHPERDDVLVHRRALTKDVLPGVWDFAFGGVAGVGETWEDAGVRELAEETGLELLPGDLISLGPPIHYADDTIAELARAWFVRSAGPFAFDPDEVIETAWLPLDDFDDWVTANEVAPDTVFVLTPHLRELTG